MSLPEKKPALFLMVDDDQICRFAFLRALKKLGVTNTVMEARDGQEALERLLAEHGKGPLPPVVVVLDQHMPRMDGREFVEALSRWPCFDHVRIFVSGVDLAPERICPSLRERAHGQLSKCDIAGSVRQIFDALRGTPPVLLLPT